MSVFIVGFVLNETYECQQGLNVFWTAWSFPYEEKNIHKYLRVKKFTALLLCFSFLSNNVRWHHFAVVIFITKPLKCLNLTCVLRRNGKQNNMAPLISPPVKNNEYFVRRVIPFCSIVSTFMLSGFVLQQCKHWLYIQNGFNCLNVRKANESELRSWGLCPSRSFLWHGKFIGPM